MSRLCSIGVCLTIALTDIWPVLAQSPERGIWGREILSQPFGK